MPLCIISNVSQISWLTINCIIITSMSVYWQVLFRSYWALKSAFCDSVDIWAQQPFKWHPSPPCSWSSVLIDWGGSWLVPSHWVCFPSTELGLSTNAEVFNGQLQNCGEQFAELHKKWIGLETRASPLIISTSPCLTPHLFLCSGAEKWPDENVQYEMHGRTALTSLCPWELADCVVNTNPIPLASGHVCTWPLGEAEQL